MRIGFFRRLFNTEIFCLHIPRFSVDGISGTSYNIFMTKDEDHLRLLSVFNYVLSGLCLFGTFIPLIYIGLGIFIIAGGSEWMGAPLDPEMSIMGGVFIIIGLVFLAIVVGAGICGIISGRLMAKRKYYMYSFVFACIQCAFSPLGTVLGVFTIIVLSRESVRELYNRSKNYQQENTPPGY